MEKNINMFLLCIFLCHSSAYLGNLHFKILFEKQKLPFYFFFLSVKMSTGVKYFYDQQLTFHLSSLNII